MAGDKLLPNANTPAIALRPRRRGPFGRLRAGSALHRQVKGASTRGPATDRGWSRRWLFPSVYPERNCSAAANPTRQEASRGGVNYCQRGYSPPESPRCAVRPSGQGVVNVRRQTVVMPLLVLLIAALLVLPLAGCGPKRAQSGDTVHATATGKRYHRVGCRSLSRSDIPMTRKEAEHRGLTPCRVCKP